VTHCQTSKLAGRVTGKKVQPDPNMGDSSGRNQGFTGFVRVMAASKVMRRLKGNLEQLKQKRK